MSVSLVSFDVNNKLGTQARHLRYLTIADILIMMETLFVDSESYSKILK